MSRIGGHIRGNVVAYLALFIALGGTSYAAATLPRNSVRAKQIAPRSVGASELKDGAVTSRKVRGLRLEDFKPGELSGLVGGTGVGAQGIAGSKGSPGPQGPEGLTGPPGPIGPAGPAVQPGDRSVVYVSRTTTIEKQQTGADIGAAIALCPNATGADPFVVVNGWADQSSVDTVLIYSAPIRDADADAFPFLNDADGAPDDGWETDFFNTDTENAHDVTVTAICITQDELAAIQG